MLLGWGVSVNLYMHFTKRFDQCATKRQKGQKDRNHAFARLEVQWVVMGWGVGVFFHWLQISERFSLFGSKWEKEQVEKRLGRKL